MNNVDPSGLDLTVVCDAQDSSGTCTAAHYDGTVADMSTELARLNDTGAGDSEPALLLQIAINSGGAPTDQVMSPVLVVVDTTEGQTAVIGDFPQVDGPPIPTAATPSQPSQSIIQKLNNLSLTLAVTGATTEDVIVAVGCTVGEDFEVAWEGSILVGCAGGQVIGNAAARPIEIASTITGALATGIGCLQHADAKCGAGIVLEYISAKAPDANISAIATTISVCLNGGDNVHLFGVHVC